MTIALPILELERMVDYQVHGVVMIFVKSSIAAYVSVQKSLKSFIWCQIG